MDVLKELEKLQAQAESTADNKALTQINSLIEQTRPLTQNEVVCLINEKLKGF